MDAAPEIRVNKKISKGDDKNSKTEVKEHKELCNNTEDHQSKSETKENENKLEQLLSTLTAGRQNSSKSSSHPCSFDFTKNEQNVDDTDSAPVCTNCTIQIKRCVSSEGLQFCPLFSFKKKIIFFS